MSVYNSIQKVLAAVWFRKRMEKAKVREAQATHASERALPTRGGVVRRRGIPTPAYFKRSSQAKRRRVNRRVGR